MSGDDELDFIRKQVKAGLPPWPEPDLKTDLWPRMLRRLEDAPVRFGWFEGLLAAAIVVVFAAFPELIPVLFYHL